MRQQGPSAREQAEMWGVSERWVRMVRAIERVRPELAAEVLNGALSAHMALQMVRGETPVPNSGYSVKFDRLRRAWNNCSDYDRQQFIDELGLVLGE